MSRHVLLVEGTSDYGVVRNLWARHHPEFTPFEIDVRFGLPNLREAFRGSLLASDISRLGLVVDADEDANLRWQAFYQALVESGYKPVPKSPPSEGMVLHRTDRTVPIVGIWVMPDNQLPGRLEDFVRRLVPPGDDLWTHAGKIVDEIPEELRRFRAIHRAKAHVHTWLAWQREPGMRLGPAVTRRLLDSGAPEAVRMVAWLRRLFAGEPPSSQAARG